MSMLNQNLNLHLDLVSLVKVSFQTALKPNKHKLPIH